MTRDKGKARAGGRSAARAQVRVRRVYEEPDPADGTRVLVDRVWPRGMRRDDPRLGEWDRDVAPSPELRRWYGHDPDRYSEFAERYRAELTAPEAGAAGEALDRLRERAARGRLTLLTATREPDLSHARVLADLLTEDG